MAELRYFIKSITETKQTLEMQNASYKGAYSFTDFIYQPKNRPLDLNAEFIRLRSYHHTNWLQKDFVLVHKLKDKATQATHIFIHKEFDTFEESQEYLKDYSLLFSFFRNGFEYALQDMRIFVEDVQYLNPSIEIVAPYDAQIYTLFAMLPITKSNTDSVPKLIEKQIHKRN